MGLTEEEKNIDSRVKAINEMQRFVEMQKIIETTLYTISPEYKETSKKTPLTIANHPKFDNPPRRKTIR
jgi:hypothetical protein